MTLLDCIKIILAKKEPTHQYEVMSEIHFHLKNQIENYKQLSAKYPINLDYLVAAAIYMTEEIEKNAELALEVNRRKIHFLNNNKNKC